MSQIRHVATGEEAYFASNEIYSADIGNLDGMVVEEDVLITISPGNSGDIASSFRIHGRHPQASHEYDWVSDPLPGEPNLVISD